MTDTIELNRRVAKKLGWMETPNQVDELTAWFKTGSSGIKDRWHQNGSAWADSADVALRKLYEGGSDNATDALHWKYSISADFYDGWLHYGLTDRDSGLVAYEGSTLAIAICKAFLETNGKDE